MTQDDALHSEVNVLVKKTDNLCDNIVPNIQKDVTASQTQQTALNETQTKHATKVMCSGVRRAKQAPVNIQASRTLDDKIEYRLVRYSLLLYVMSV